jgi:hypothetical protein
MHLHQKIGYYKRIQSGMYHYCRTPVLPDHKKSILDNLYRRETNWLDTLYKTIFSQPSNPYNGMFRLAGCSYQDLAHLVYREGIEKTLSILYREGVYLDHDEFKGLLPIVRFGKEIPSRPESFANPLIAGWFSGESGGSRSAGTMTCTGTKQLVHLSRYATLNAEEFGLREFNYIITRPILPSIAGLLFALLYSRIGCSVGPWYAFGGKASNSYHYRLLTGYIVAMARLNGFQVPFPRHLPRDDFSPVSRWIARQASSSTRRCALQAVASTGVRIAASAITENADISGTLFFSGAEALTDGKRRVIESAGAEVFPAYWISEIGQIGHSCKNMNEGNSVHLFEDSVAVIEESKKACFSNSEVNSLIFTTLLSHAPYIFINVEMQDSGKLSEKPCDCVYGKIGFKRQISEITSYGKLTGHGMTLVGTDIVEILEKELPSRFGGNLGDYQLVEQEGSNQTEVVLRISPRACVKTPEAVKRYFMQQLRRYKGGALAWRVWDHSETVKVIIADPLITKAGKQLPLHLIDPGNRVFSPKENTKG